MAISHFYDLQRSSFIDLVHWIHCTNGTLRQAARQAAKIFTEAGGPWCCCQMICGGVHVIAKYLLV